ncbi:MAG: hypothetical protein ACRDVK_09040 [Acidimicrobiia bacterium]
MPASNFFSPALLGPALDAARKALSRLDEDEIPVRVRVVAKRSGKLPAPLAASLIAELDRNTWLREIALVELSDAAGDEGGVGSASLEFLRRSPGWEERLAPLAEKAQSQVDQKSWRRLEGELQAARAEVLSLRRQLRKANRQTGQLPPEEPEPAERAGVRDRQKLKAALSSTEKALTASEEARQQLLTEISQLQVRVETLLRRRPDKSAPRAVPAGGMRRGPIELARDLDARLHALSVPPLEKPASPIPPEADPAEALSIPTGVRPDSAAAIDWLFSYPGPMTVAVDGWNLAFQLKNPPGRKERGQLEAAVGRLNHKAAGKRKLLVLFDSRFDVDGTHPGTHPDVEVRFPASADEALIELAREEPSLVVITSDRRVREEAGRSGAVGLWGEALVEWLR